MLTVVTGWTDAGFELYGRRFIEGFQRHWPTDGVHLIVYVWCLRPLSIGESRFPPTATFEFVNRHSKSNLACGKQPISCWRAEERERGYSFRSDAVKFCQMSTYPADAALTAPPGILLWLDGDVMTHQDVPPTFVADMLGDADCAYLGRQPAHSETGFVAFKIPAARPLIDEWARLYLSDEVFELPEWHAAYVFDRAREKFEAAGGVCKSLTPAGARGHVWVKSPLANYLDHLKGNRKHKDRSPERDRK